MPGLRKEQGSAASGAPVPYLACSTCVLCLVNGTVLALYCNKSGDRQGRALTVQAFGVAHAGFADCQNCRLGVARQALAKTTADPENYADQSGAGVSPVEASPLQRRKAHRSELCARLPYS